MYNAIPGKGECEMATIRVTVCLAVACLLGVNLAVSQGEELPEVSRADVEKMIGQLSNWGRWGDADELGTLNLITPQKRREAATLVKAGVSVSMAHDAVKIEMDSSSPFEHLRRVRRVYLHTGTLT